MRYALLPLSLTLLATSVFADETDISGKISVELNTAQSSEGGCNLTFVVTNGLTTPIDQLVVEAVLFNTTGKVDRLTLFDFGAAPVARPRVRQFGVPQLSCENLGRVLFNGSQTCAGTGLDTGTCDAAILPTSRTEIEAIG